jgi:hypothetical protein
MDQNNTKSTKKDTPQIIKQNNKSHPIKPFSPPLLFPHGDEKLIQSYCIFYIDGVIQYIFQRSKFTHIKNKGVEELIQKIKIL